jgi:hypothetical protein
MDDPMDARPGRKVLAEVWTQQGWRYRSSWTVVLPREFAGAVMVLSADRKTGAITMEIEGYEIPELRDKTKETE